MLTSQSYIAINQFLPSVKPMKGHVKVFFDHLERFEPTYQQISSKTSKKKITSQSLQSEQFIDEHLKKDIIKLHNCREVVFKTGPTTFQINIHYKNESLDLFIDTLMYCLSFVSMLTTHNKKNIKMNYYLLDTKRVLDDDTTFDKEEVNGGACGSVDSECGITVWRKEEILKVSIHELIHCLDYDYKNDTSDIIQHYQQKYNITSQKMNTFEAYTEIYAALLHSYLVSRLYHKIDPSFKSYDLFVANVGIEMEFSQLQATKVLSLLDKNKDMNKETNVCAYYIIKTELYEDLPNFLKFCLSNNKDIIKLTDTSKYFEYLKELNKVNKKKYKVTGYLKETTRMTCLEIDLF